jgi:hypothetical protein
MSFEIPKTMKVVGFENSENLKIQDLTLCCAIINERFSEYYVMTNKQKFEKIISDASNESRENQILMFKILHENINKYTDEQLYKCFNEKNNEWDNWCNDVALFYAYRHLLFPTKPIPIAHPSFNKI